MERIGYMWILVAIGLGFGSTLSACTTSSDTTVAAGAKPIQAGSAYLVVHGGNSTDVDGHIQRALVRHGMQVSMGLAENVPAHVDYVVKYADFWRWDVVMYLRKLEIMFYRQPAGELIATGRWKNSPLHGYQSAEKVVDETIDQVFTKLEEQSGATPQP